MDHPVVVDPTLDEALQGFAFASLKGQCDLKPDTRFVIMDEKGRGFSIDASFLEESKNSNDGIIFNNKLQSIVVNLRLLRNIEFDEDQICLMSVREKNVRFRALPHPCPI